MLFAVTEDPDGKRRVAESLRRIREVLRAEGVGVRWLTDIADAVAVVRSDASPVGLVTQWLPPGENGSESRSAELLRAVARSFRGLPVYLLERGGTLQEMPLWVSDVATGYLWPDEDTPASVGGRIANAVAEYRRAVLPPFFGALSEFHDTHEYSWHTPAHGGGVAFLRSAAGREASGDGIQASRILRCATRAASFHAAEKPEGVSAWALVGGAAAALVAGAVGVRGLRRRRGVARAA
ncbi:Orn/Lys/Arg decarboxylase N-terminal domain-containing protein [Streptomyces sp. HUAS MG91]|uniref:Orn/Lys/Arg decarboxylase N-terminal domain-containing protein n=1 Tax=Streptomyces tabacisoli TaxID=3156398 RepID=A0AAU8IZG5_9ACTN